MAGGDFDSRGLRTSVVQSASTKFVWSGWSMIAKLNAGTSGTGSTHSKSYLWGPDFSNANGAAGGAGGLLAVRQDNTTYFPAYDVFGNITGYLNASNGNVVAKWDFNPFLNLYGFVGNGPTRGWDVLGLLTKSVFVATGTVPLSVEWRSERVLLIECGAQHVEKSWTRGKA